MVKCHRNSRLSRYSDPGRPCSTLRACTPRAINLDMLINSNSLSTRLQELAIRVNQTMLTIMTAGATGEF